MKEWITGRNPVYETLRAGRRQRFRLLVAEGAHEKGRLEQIIASSREHGVPIERVPRVRVDSLGENPQGVALEVGGYPYTGLADIIARAAARGEPLFALLLDELQNPQNFGTLLRTAEATGVHGAVIPFRHAVGVTPAVVSASAGASEHLLIAQTNLAQACRELKDAGAWVVGLEDSPQAQSPVEVHLDGPLALVVGNEGEGMRPLVRQSCDLLLRLPMRGQIESLNASVAGSIALYLALLARI